MADVTLSKIASYLYDMRSPTQQLFPKDNFLMATWFNAGSDGAPGLTTPLNNPTAFNGAKVRMPIDVVGMEGGGWVAEGGTVNVPIAPTLTQAEVTLKKFIQPFGISMEAMEDSKGANSAVDQTQYNLDKARIAMADKMNVAMNGSGDGLLGNVLSGSNLTWVLGTGSAGAGIDWDQFYVGQLVDILTTATGADAGQGKRRKINSITISTGTIVFDTAQQASDGGSGSITASSASGLYIPGSYGNVLAGGIQAAGAGTTFQNVTLATYPQFKFVDGRAGDTSSLPLSDAMVDTGIILGNRAGTGMYDFGVGDPNAINVYKNAKANQVRYAVPTGTVSGRFSGTQIDAGNGVITLVGERKFKSGSIILAKRDAATLYASTSGPEYENHTGSMFKQFNRNTNFEVWLYFRPEWGWHNPSKLLHFDNLAVQSTAG